ncbi:MAG: hypothetical protein R3B12_00555 [Candidatus Saccharimonadales bacterium]
MIVPTVDVPKQHTTKLFMVFGPVIRSLVEDIGNKLGTGAYMSDLRRTKIGSYMLEEAVPLGELNTETIQSYLQIDLK